MNVHTIIGSNPLFMTVGQWILDNPDCVVVAIFYEHKLHEMGTSINAEKHLVKPFVIHVEVYKAIIVYYTR
jgi:hypothetical protein